MSPSKNSNDFVYIADCRDPGQHISGISHDTFAYCDDFWKTTKKTHRPKTRKVAQYRELKYNFGVTNMLLFRGI